MSATAPHAARVLVVEDNRAFAENIAESLALEGYATRTAARMRDALASARAEPVDLVLLDVRLPDAVGTDALAALREAAPAAEVIVMSGEATLESALAAVRGGAFGYVLKPFDMDELLRLAGRAARQVALGREREALLTQLQASEARYRAVVETSPALIVGVDAAGAIALVNAAVEATTGHPREELLGEDFLARLVPAHARHAAWPARDAPEFPVQTRGGEERRIEWRYAAAHGLRYALGVDVTEARAFERRARVAEHLAAAGELTAGLAHEIRNPLNAALLELKVLGRSLARAGHEDGVASVEVIRGELDRLERLLGEFLAFAHPRVGAAMEGDLATPARAVARLVAAEAQERGITIATEFDPSVPAVAFDEERVRQVVVNLVRNAIEALGAGGRITLRTARAGALAELSVEDDGPGIEGDASRVFRPFHTTKAAGTGLGLAIAQRIAHDHGGELRVESRRGRTVFTLALPVVRGGAQAHGA